MIPKPLDAIQAEDLQALLTDQVAESKTLEYKREVPGGKDGDKIALLAGISSLANTQGGDFVIGVDAPKGVPIAVEGVVLGDPDAARARLEDILRSGIQPRLPRIDIGLILAGPGRYVVVIRVASRSWIGPHRVTFSGHDRFYGRTSAGKYPLDVGELRTAFLLSETVAERIRGFRAGRLATIASGETPVPLDRGAKSVLHVLPVTAFTTDQRLAVAEHLATLRDFQPLGGGGWDHRINLDGVVTFDRPDHAETYTQVFRDGAVEAVLVYPPRDDRRLVPSGSYEEDIMRAVPSYVSRLAQAGAGFPMFIFLALLDVRGYWLGLHPSIRGEGHQVDREAIVLPEVVIAGREFDRTAVLRPLLDMVWNAFGLPRSLNFDEKGQWRPRP
jgi:hypothetical protein